MRSLSWRVVAAAYLSGLSLLFAGTSQELSAQPAFTIDQKREILATVWEYRVRTTMDPVPLDPCSAYWSILRDVDVLPPSIWPNLTIDIHPEPGCPPSLRPSPRDSLKLPYARVVWIHAGLRTAPPRATVALQVFHPNGAWFDEEFELRYADTLPGWRVTSANRSRSGTIDFVGPRPKLFLLIVDGAVVLPTKNDSVLAAMPEGTIASVRYFAPGDTGATRLYGSAATGGVLIVTTRKQPHR